MITDIHNLRAQEAEGRFNKATEKYIESRTEIYQFCEREYNSESAEIIGEVMDNFLDALHDICIDNNMQEAESISDEIDSVMCRDF